MPAGGAGGPRRRGPDFGHARTPSPSRSPGMRAKTLSSSHACEDEVGTLMRNSMLSAARMHRALVALLPLLLLLAPTAQAHPLGGSFSAGSPGYLFHLLDHFTWPDLAPGENGAISLFLNNTYPYRMESIVLTLEIFRYADLDRTIAVDANWTFARPSFYEIATCLEIGRRFVENVAALEPREEVGISVGVVTDADAPHGSLTNQGSYFVRTAMEVSLTDGVTTNRSSQFSLGHFT